MGGCCTDAAGELTRESNKLEILGGEVSMRKMVLLIIALLLTTATLVEAQENKLGITLDLTYVSKWMSKGVEAYGQQGGLFKTIDLDFYGTGFGVKVTHRNSTSSGNVDNQRFDYRPYYRSRLFEDKPYVTKYNISLGYEHYPGLARNVSNTTFEWIFAFSWPEIFTNGIVPTYIAHYEYPAGSHYNFAFITGWVHRFILGYDIPVPQLPAPIHISTELAYTDGLGDADHDWSYFTTGLATKFKINDNISLNPGLYHQISMDDSVSKRDVTYARLTMKYKF